MSNGEGVKAPWHFWVIGVIALLWYASGAYTIQMAELGQLPGLQPDEAAYYAAKPMWQSIATGIGTYGSVFASIVLLMRRRSAVTLFAIALVLILGMSAYELSNGTSRVYANNAAAAVTGIIVVIAIFMVWYSSRMNKRGVLR
jgi:hypothetical protein